MISQSSVESRQRHTPKQATISRNANLVSSEPPLCQESWARGTHVLKGVPGEWKLYAPAGRDDPIAKLTHAPPEPAQDRVADVITRRPRVMRMLARIARKR